MVITLWQPKTFGIGLLLAVADSVTNSNFVLL